jgi:TolA-binding protein
MPRRPPSNAAGKNVPPPAEPVASTATLSTDERRTVAPDLLLDSGLVFERHKVLILAVVAVVILALIGLGMFQSYRVKTDAAASAQFDAAKTAADYQKIIDTYPGSKAAANSYLLLGRSKFTANDFAGAAQVWGDFAAKYPQHALTPAALSGKASALEALGKSNEARALYQRVATSYQSSYAAPLARLGEATLLLGERKTDEAKHVYEDVIASSPRSFAGQLAEQGLRTINALPPLGAAPSAGASPGANTPASTNALPSAGATSAAIPGAAVVDAAASAAVSPAVQPATSPSQVTPTASIAPAAAEPIKPAMVPPPAASPGAGAAQPDAGAPTSSPAVLPPASPVATPAGSH